MANILGLALKVTGDASGLPKSLTPVDRALDSLAKQAEKATAVFAPFAEKTAAAGKVQEEFAAKLANLADQLKAKVIGPQEYAAAFGQLTEEAKAAAKAFEEGLRIQKEYGDQTAIVAGEIERLLELERLGAIDTNALNNAAIERLGIDKQAAESARARADAVAAAERQQAEAFAAARKVEEEAAAAANRQRASLEAEAQRIRQANLTAQEVFNQAIERARVLNQARLLTDQEFNRELERQAQLFAKATIAAGRLEQTIEQTGKQGALRFNEISGILSVLPGPIGLAAARLSAFASAADGLGRVLSGGASTKLNALGLSIVAFSASAKAAVQGLVALEGRVEALGNAALRLGTDFQTIQVLDEAARRVGGSLEEVAAGLQRFNVNLNEARTGSGAAAEAFLQLGISQEQLATTDTPALAKRVADAIQGIEDPAKRSALAVATLGKNGLTLLPAFNAIEESRIAMERFASAIGTVDEQRISTLGKSFDNVKTAVAGFGQAALLPFAGVVEGFANLLADLIATVTRLAQAIGTVLTPVLDAIGETFSAVGDGVFYVTSLFDGWLGNTENAKASVDKLRASVEEPLAGGFAKDFEKTLQNITESVSNAIDESAKFGQAGFDAAFKYQAAINDLKAKLDSDLFNEETFRREAEKAGVAFKAELARIQEDAQLEIQIKADAEKTLAGINEQISKAINGAMQFGQAGFDAAAEFQNKLRDLGRQFEDERINAATLAQEVARATAEYDKQIEGIKTIQKLQEDLLRADKDRVNELLAQGNVQTQAEKDIETVLREQLRLEDEIRKQRQAGNVFAADAAAGRLAQLDQLQARLAEEQQAVEQGFGDGFAKAFEATNKGIDDLIAKAEQFGSAGALAFDALRAGVERAQQQAKDGILTQETYQREVARQQDLFNQRLAGIQRVEDFMMFKMDERQKAELEATKQLEERKKQAAVNVQAIEAKIIDEKNKLEAARSGNDLKAAKTAQANINALTRARLQEQRIANGQNAITQRQAQQQNGNLARMQQFQGLIAQQNSNFLKSFQNAYAGANSAIAAANAAAEQQARKLQQILTPGPRTVQGADVRTAEGAALVIGLAANELDPALVEARQQTKQLKAIQQAILGSASAYLNTPVEIV